MHPMNHAENPLHGPFLFAVTLLEQEEGWPSTAPGQAKSDPRGVGPDFGTSWTQWRGGFDLGRAIQAIVSSSGRDASELAGRSDADEQSVVAESGSKIAWGNLTGFLAGS
jgi:hypothetical protein